MFKQRRETWVRLFFALAVLLCAVESQGQWSAVYRNAIELDQAAAFGIEELSGVTLVQQISGDTFRIGTIQDDGGVVGQADVVISPNGTLLSAVAKSGVVIDGASFDNEGIAFTNTDRNSVFVAAERDQDANVIIPSVREYDLTSGALMQSVTMPSVWNVDGHTLRNRGFESLARMPHGRSLWTGNEEAITIDGPRSDELLGSTIRLQKINLSGANALAAEQYAYNVSPIHSSNDPNRSGLVDLVGLPDGTLLTLERSAATAIPALLNSMFVVDFAAATDVSDDRYDDGLTAQPFVPVTKSPVWSGAVSGFLGSNMEGLALGPQLPNGNWTLIGVSDNGGGALGNRIVGFELIPPTAYGDFDRDGDFDCSDAARLGAAVSEGDHAAEFDLNSDGLVDAADQSEWLNDASTALGASPRAGDANLDGEVDELDFTIWNEHRFTASASWCDGDFNQDGFVDVSDFSVWNTHRDAVVGAAVPEPVVCRPFLLACILFLTWRRR